MGITFITAKAIVVTAAVLIPLIMLLVHRWRVGSIIIPTSPVVYAALMLPVAYALSMFFAVDRSTALLGLGFNTDSLAMVTLGVLAMLMVVLTGLNKGHFKGVDIRKCLVRLMWLAVVLFAVQVIWQVVATVPTWLTNVNIAGSWVDASALVALLVIMYMRGASSKPDGKPNYTYTVLIGLLTLILVLFLHVISVVAILAMVSAVYILSIIYKNRGDNLNKALLVVPGVVLVITGFFTLDNTLFNSKTSLTLQNLTQISFVDIRPNWQGTLDVAKGTVGDSDIKAKLFGPGVGSFADQWRVYKPVAVNTTKFWNTNFDNAIGFIPTSIITGGIVVFVVWLALLFILAKLAYRVRRSKMMYPTLFIWLFMVFNPVNYVMLLVAFVITGMLVVDGIRGNEIKATKYRLTGVEKNKFVAYLAMPILLVSSIAVMGIILHRSVVTSYLVRASDAVLEQNSNKAEQLLSTVNTIADMAVIEQGYTRIAFSKLNLLVATSNKEKKEISPEELQAALSNVLSHAQRAIEKDMSDPANYTTLGSISEQLIGLKIEGARESAVAAYKQAATLDPLNPTIPFALARLSAGDEDKTQYVSYIEQSLKIKPNYVPALYQYALVKLNDGKKDEAAQLLFTVVQIDNSHANALYYLSALLSERGQDKDALVLMKRVQLLNKDNKDVAKIIAGLEARSTAKPAKPLEKTE